MGSPTTTTPTTTTPTTTTPTTTTPTTTTPTTTTPTTTTPTTTTPTTSTPTTSTPTTTTPTTSTSTTSTSTTTTNSPNFAPVKKANGPGRPRLHPISSTQKKSPLHSVVSTTPMKKEKEKERPESWHSFEVWNSDEIHKVYFLLRSSVPMLRSSVKLPNCFVKITWKRVQSSLSDEFLSTTRILVQSLEEKISNIDVVCGKSN